MTLKRRSRLTCEPMPYQLSARHVQDLYSWPLGQTMTRKASGTGWTDCLVFLVDTIRLGGWHNSRRLRYDGRFYISWARHGAARERVYLDAELSARALDIVQHVYGIDAESDVLHNKALKGY